MMGVENLLSGGYTLEVSSPGIDRPLFTLEHYRKYVGSKVKIRLQTPIDGQRQFKGILMRVEGDDIYFSSEQSQQELCVPFSRIEKANLIGDVRF
jgi:ribosome maturation factor RimP